MKSFALPTPPCKRPSSLEYELRVSGIQELAEEAGRMPTEAYPEPAHL